jgi:hypothetical protein
VAGPVPRTQSTTATHGSNTVLLIIHNPNPTGTLKVQKPENGEDWVTLACARKDDEVVPMTQGRTGTFIVIDLTKGTVVDTFANRTQKVSV